MRIVVVFLLFSFMQPAIAITKCLLNGKVTYKRGICPENAVSQYLIKNEYVEKSQLQQYQRERKVESEKEFKRLSTLKRYDENGTLIDPEDYSAKIEQIRKPNAAPDSQLQSEDEQAAKINIYEKQNDINAKLLEMQRMVDQRNKALQQLQQQ